MRPDSAISRLKDGELCIVTMKDGEHQVRWSVGVSSIFAKARRWFVVPTR
jgi:hypothetical protein